MEEKQRKEKEIRGIEISKKILIINKEKLEREQEEKERKEREERERKEREDREELERKEREAKKVIKFDFFLLR